LFAIVILGTGAMTFAQSLAPDRARMVAGYVNMCMTDSINRPPPFGDSDLKDSPKLEAYCQCFSGKFTDRLILKLQNPGAPRRPLKETLAEERAMHNSCRQELGLPLIKYPDLPDR
jgi:hypothetical protein